MAKVAITESYLEDIADAIRSKTGLSTTAFLPSEMAPAIMTISGGGGITPTGTISIIENGTYNVSTYASANVNVPTGSTINNQNKTVNPTTSQQSITYDEGYTGLGTVTVNAMSTMTLPTSAAGSATSGYTSKATISRSTSDQYINIPTGYNSAGAYYKVSAVANGTAGTPSASKGTVSNHSISITPSVTNTTGYITGSTKTGTAVTVSASELVSGTLSVTSNGTKDVTNYASVNVQIGSDVNNQNKTVTPTTSVQEITADSGYSGLGIVTVNAMPTMTLPTSAASSATSGYTSKATIGRSTSDQYINIPTGYNSAGGYYKISAVANGSATGPTSLSGSSATVTTGTNTITLTKTGVTTTPTVSAGYVASATASTATVALTASVTTKAAATITPGTTNQTIASGTYLTGTQTIAGSSNLVAGNIKKNVTIFGVTGSYEASSTEPTIEELEITPSESAQTFNSSDVDGYKPVSVSAISTTYVGSGITRRNSDDLVGALNTSTYDVTVPIGYYASDETFSITRKSSDDLTASVIAGYLRVNIPEGYYITSGKPIIKAKTSDDLTVSGATVTVPAGYYASVASKSVTTMTLPTSAASSATSGYTSKATISRSTSDQYINIAPGYNSAGGYYKISAVANGSATPAASITGTSATITTGANTITLTKSVSNTPQVTAGYVSSGTAGNSSVSLTASMTVDPTPTASGATVTIPAGYYTESTSKAVTTMTLPTSASSSATRGYTKKATISRSTSAQYINIAPGYNSAGGYYEISAVANGSASAPSTISGTSATVSTGTNTITLTKTVSVTPSVSAGYVSSGTATNSSVSLTASVTTKAAATITPGTTNQTIASGTYLTGTQTIAGDADLVASNIVSGVQIFGVTGNVVLQNYYTGSSAPSSSLGQNGDIYIQQ